MLESVQNYTVQTYKKVMSSRAADYVRANSVLVGIVGLAALAAACYGVYRYRNREVEDQTNNPPAPPIPPPHNPPPINRKTLVQKIAIPFKLRELGKIDLDTLMNNAKTINENVQDLNEVLQNKNHANYINAVIIALATKPKQRIAIFNDHKATAQKHFEEIIQFEKAAYPGDLRKKTAPDFIWDLCLSTRDEELLENAADAVESDLAKNFVALDPEEKTNFLLRSNEETVDLLFRHLQDEPKYTSTYLTTLETALNLHFDHNDMDEDIMPYVLLPQEGESTNKLADDALQFFLKRNIDELSPFSECYGHITLQTLKAWVTKQVYPLQAYALVLPNLNLDEVTEFYHLCSPKAQKLIIKYIYPEDREMQLDLIPSAKFEYSDLPANTTLDELMPRMQDVKNNIQNLEGYVKDTYAETGKNTTAFTLYLLLAKDDAERSNRFWYSGTQFEYLEKTLAEYCKFKNMQIGDKTYQWIAEMISDTTNEVNHTMLFAKVLHTHKCLKHFYDNCSDDMLTDRIYNNSDENIQKILDDQPAIDPPD